MKNNDDIQTIKPHLPDELPNWEAERWWEKSKSRIKIPQGFFKNKKNILLIVAFFILLLLLLISLSINSQQRSPDILEQPEHTVIQDQELTPLQSQIKELRSQLKKADPAIKESPIPAVEMNLRID
jgi:LPS O-antigen subunit length determinant protein (WzzB/FepE family)